MKKSKKSRAQQSRSLGMEKLEDRTMMAGDVSVSISNGDLLITGDNASNSVYVRSTGQIDEFEVVGRTFAGSRTTINGGTRSFKFNNYDFSDDIRVSMKGGHDRVRMYGANAGFGDLDAWNDLNIKTGSGNDKVYLKYVEAGGQGASDSDILVDLGSGSNYIYGKYVDVADDFRISTPDISQSTAHKTRVDLYFQDIGDQMDIDLRWSTGVVNLYDVDCDDMLVDLYSGNDKLNVRNSSARRTDLDGGSGTDDLNLYGNSHSFNRNSFKSPTYYSSLKYT